MKVIYKLSILVVGILFFSCNDNDIFDKELYEKQIYLVSGDDNVRPLEYAFDSDEQEIVTYISVAYSGTQSLDKDVNVNLIKDEESIYAYNYSHFDIDEEKYAKELESSRFRMPSKSTTIEANSENVYASIPVYMKPNDLVGLSPDEIYFIPLKIENTSEYKISEKKSNILARIFFKNKYAAVKDVTNYLAKGFQQTNGGSLSSTSLTKQMHPISKDEVRIFAGVNNYNAASKTLKRDIEQYGIIIKVENDQTLHLSSFNKDGSFMELEQLEAPSNETNFVYLNVYKKEEAAFYIYYKFRSYEYKDKVWKWSDWYTVREKVQRYKM